MGELARAPEEGTNMSATTKADAPKTSPRERDPVQPARSHRLCQLPRRGDAPGRCGNPLPERPEVPPSSQAPVRGLFTSLIRVDAPWRTPDEVNLDFHINGIALRIMSSLEEFEDLHENARSSRVFSEFATEQLIPYIPKIYKDLEEAIGGAGGGTSPPSEERVAMQSNRRTARTARARERTKGGTGEGKAQDEGEGQGKGDGQDGGKGSQGENENAGTDKGDGNAKDSRTRTARATKPPTDVPGGDSYGTEEGDEGSHRTVGRTAARC